VTRPRGAGGTVPGKLRAGACGCLAGGGRREDPPADARELAGIAVALLDQFGERESTRFRLAGVGVSNFLDGAPETPQTELFPEEE